MKQRVRRLFNDRPRLSLTLLQVIIAWKSDQVRNEGKFSELKKCRNCHNRRPQQHLTLRSNVVVIESERERQFVCYDRQERLDYFRRKAQKHDLHEERE